MSTWNSMLTESFHFLSPDQTFFHPKALWEKSNLDKISTWLLFRSQWGRRLWAKTQLFLNQTFALRDTERKKRCLRRRGVATHVVSQISCSIPNSTFKLCLMISGRNHHNHHILEETSQTHVAQFSDCFLQKLLELKCVQHPEWTWPTLGCQTCEAPGQIQIVDLSASLKADFSKRA